MVRIRMNGGRGRAQFYHFPDPNVGEDFLSSDSAGLSGVGSKDQGVEGVGDELSGNSQEVERW